MSLKKRKKILFIIVITLLILIFFVWPINLVEAPNNFEIYRVTYQDKDITKEINLEQLTAILKKYDTRRTFQIYTPYSCTDVIMEIDSIDGQKTKHIVLGNINFSYEYNNKGTRNIIDSEKLIYEIITNVINK